MADDDEPIIIGDWETLIAKQRTKNGKQRVTLEVKAEPLMIDLGEVRMGKPIAEAIAESLRESLLASNDPIAPSSAARRQAATTGYERQTKSAREEFTGGRIGPTPPNQGKARGYNSGRLAKSIVAMWVEKLGSYVINTAANRLTPDFRARAPRFVEWLAGKMTGALSSERVARAVVESISGAVVKVDDAAAAIRKRIADNARALVDASRGLANEAQSEFGDQEDS